MFKIDTNIGIYPGYTRDISGISLTYSRVNDGFLLTLFQIVKTLRSGRGIFALKKDHMITFTEKINILKSCLETVDHSYADSFKAEMLLYFNGFDPADPKLDFLHELDFEEEITGWVNRITSLIVLKLEQEEEAWGEFEEWE